MSIHKDEKRNGYYVKYRINGVSTTSKRFDTKKEAQLFESRVLLEDDSYDCVFTFKEIAYEYLDNLKKESAYSTYSKCLTTFEKTIFPNIKNKRMKDYEELDCKRFKDKLYEIQKSTSLRNHTLGKYKAVFKYATKYHHLKRDPSQILDPFKKSFEEKMKVKTKENEVWNDNEFSAFIKCVDNETYRMFYILLYYTGMRLGELLALTWRDYNGKSLNVYKSIPKATEDGNLTPKETKNTASIRRVSLPANICELLNEYKLKEEDIPGYTDDWYIVGRLEPLPRTNINRYKDEAIKKAHVKRITIHQFRHSHASNLINNKMPIIAVSRRLGHSDINMTLKVYAHLFGESDDEILNYLQTKSNNLI